MCYLDSYFEGVCLCSNPIHDASDEEHDELALGAVVDDYRSIEEIEEHKPN